MRLQQDIRACWGGISACVMNLESGTRAKADAGVQKKANMAWQYTRALVPAIEEREQANRLLERMLQCVALSSSSRAAELAEKTNFNGLLALHPDELSCKGPNLCPQ